ncbi:Na(+)-translocating NADH-quinone reductase subunit C [Psychrobacter sp. FDAARGOS_221]|uniref:Na(+)-translocating NADH-quinone reductase subunit C n=1 Tax=Psychrobacter sp. FDAARGOS_221 TaxID=1975705 RepID=UPI000BB53C49|nr:Na(+)-translocating NADH-quinone reductase subunit C [Psychrobacter sp. FDAARGOS_221]PNK60643.1 Na(+)-translocating NADH-quinone reductase subunit C [Psychrobacter sp. FDAARGOS_221]
MSQQTKKSNSNMTTIMVALVLCLVCSVLVSAVAVGLKPAQVDNQLLDRNKNILVAAGLFDPATDTNEDVQSRFDDFEIKLVDLEKGEYATEDQLATAGIEDVNAYDANQASKNKALSIDLGNDDPASIGAVPKFAKVYVKNDADGKPELMVLPVHGYGLWGTIYGFLTLEGDLNTVKGISWYEHKETPGLGARIEEPKWRAQWEGIHAYDENGEVATGVTKAGQSRDNWVDGISGATLTSVGVRNLIQFWLGERGYKPFLDNLRGGTPDSDANAQTQTTTGEEA